MRVHKLLRSFWVNLVAIAVGVAIGLLFEQSAKYFSIFGRLYLSLLAMTVLPIVFSAITHGVGQLLRSGNFSRSLGYLIVIFVGWILLGALIGILSGTVGMAGSGLSDAELNGLGKLLMHDSGPIGQAKGPSAGLGGSSSSSFPATCFRPLRAIRA